MRSRLFGLIVATVIVTAPSARAQQYLEGLWLGTESGDVIELIAWAERQGWRPWRMANGSLEDAPVIPRTYRILNSMPAWQVVGVVAATTDMFVRDLDRMETVPLKFSATKLTISTVEIGIPELERWENVLRLRKTLRASPEKPMYVFLALDNGTVARFYPFRVDRPAP